MVLLDTHAAIWFATEDTTLGRRSRALISRALADTRLAICSISFWEIAMLVSKKRIEASVPPLELRALLLDTGIVELPLTGDIAMQSVALELHGDPADRFIAATEHRATLVTADHHLLQWKSPVKRQNAMK